jgi:hypothetical protein
MGAALATGILDAGGRNVTVGLRSRSGYFRRTSVVGLALFTYSWWVGWGAVMDWWWLREFPGRKLSVLPCAHPRMPT